MALPHAMDCLHIFTHFRQLGGVQSLLRRHLARDPDSGITSSVVALFDPVPLSENFQATALGCHGWHSIRELRRRFYRASEERSPGTVTYHNFWGAPFLHDMDRASRRIAVLHSDWTGIEDTLRRQHGLFDGVLCVSRPLVNLVRTSRIVPDASRLALIPLPVDPPIDTYHDPTGQMSSKTLRLGFAGRISHQQKRVDRLPGFLASLDLQTKDWTFDLLGDGPQSAWLQSRLGYDARVRFLGRRSGDEYWKVLSNWDAIVFFSDYEGLPLALLETFSLGGLAVFPKIDCGGDAYVEQLNPNLLYPAGDLTAAAKGAAMVLQLKSSTPEITEKAKALTRPHMGGAYERTFADFSKHIAALPRISALNRRGKTASLLGDGVPMGLLFRWQQIRHRAAALLRIL